MGEIVRRIDQVPKEQCTGCSACSQSCPRGCISMQEDIEGFLYPLIEEENCKECGICWKCCPSVNLSDIAKYSQNDYRQKLFAAMLLDDQKRVASSSGGAFTALAEVVLKENGKVIGVSFGESPYIVQHCVVDGPNYLDSLRRSKFVQSQKNDIFSQTKKLLAKHKVLFSGTPCEIVGLLAFLGSDHPNLITCDIICGCVSSPKVYRKYLSHLEAVNKNPIRAVNFKDKSRGWQNRGIMIQFENQYVYRNTTEDDPYIVSFHSRLNIRPSCFYCAYRGTRRYSDITIGDFWGVKYLNPDLDDDKGTSFVLVNSAKGEDLFNKTEMKKRICDLDLSAYGSAYNVSFVKSPEPPDVKTRENFYKDIDHIDFGAIFLKYLETIRNERKERKRRYFEELERLNDKSCDN